MNIICGEGHIWYLPMLLECFILAYIVKDVKRPCLYLLGTLIISSFSRCPNIFRISQVAYYFFFFYLGIFVSRYRNTTVRYISEMRSKIIFAIGLLFVASLIVLLPLNIQLKSYQAETRINGYFLAALSRFINIIYSSIGIAFWYTISVHIAKRITQVPFWIKQFNILSMGVYIFHQFVLMFLYYHTSLPVICGSYFLPWVAIVITLPSSILLAYLFRLSKIGKLLI